VKSCQEGGSFEEVGLRRKMAFQAGTLSVFNDVESLITFKEPGAMEKEEEEDFLMKDQEHVQFKRWK
jgi:hypothetical protein